VRRDIHCTAMSPISRRAMIAAKPAIQIVKATSSQRTPSSICRSDRLGAGLAGIADVGDVEAAMGAGEGALTSRTA
jgi:hypothetical protein